MKLNKNTKIVIAIIGIFTFVILGLYLNSKRYTPEFMWGTNYVYTNDQPYGTNILYKLLSSYSEKQLEIIETENVRDFLKNREAVEVATYFVIGNHCNYGTDDINAIKQFAKKGNSVFMALEELSIDFLEEINSECDYEWYSSIHKEALFTPANFKDSLLKSKKPYPFHYEWLGKEKIRHWNYFSEDFCENELHFTTLGNLERNKSNFIKIKMGKGQILLHSNPIFFTNLNLIQKDKADYVAKVLSYFPDGPIYWDRNSKLWSITNSYEGNKETTPFAYILNQKSFQWAFYLLWVFIVLFVLFNLWRKQREIPVIFPKTNSTLEFIQTIGELYFTRKNNRKLALQKMDLFVKSLRSKYNITEKEEEKFILLLSKKSEVSIKQIQQIFKMYHNIKKSSEEIHDDLLIRFYNRLETFNKQRK